MYCRNCGNKLENNDIFCPECGLKIRIQKKEPLIDFKTLSVKYKKYFITLCSLLVIIVLYMCLYNNFFSEDAVIRRYIKAYANKDYETVIKLAGISKNEFITSSTIKEKYGTTNLNIVDVKVLTTSNIKEEHTRTVSYSINGKSTTTNITIKKAGQKYLIFNNYIITSTDLIAKNVKFTVPKDATLIIDNVELGSKYLSSSKTNTKTYKISSLLKKNVQITLKLANGITITDTKSIFNNELINYTKLNYSDIDKNSTTKLSSIVEDSVNTIVNKATANKDFSEVTESNLYTDDLKKSTVFSDNYQTLKDKYSNKNITDFKITSINIDNVKLEDSKSLSVKATINYSYKDENSKLHETSRVVNLVLTNDLLIKEFYLISLSYMF